MMARWPLSLLLMGLWGSIFSLAKRTSPKQPTCGGGAVGRMASTNATLNRLLSAWSEVAGGCRGHIRLQAKVYQLDQEYIFDGAFHVTLSGPKPSRRASALSRSATLLQPPSGERLFTAASGAQLTLENLRITCPDIGALRRRALSLKTFLQDLLASLSLNKTPTPTTQEAQRPNSKDKTPTPTTQEGQRPKDKDPDQAAQSMPTVAPTVVKPAPPPSFAWSACPAFAPDLHLYGGALLAFGCPNSTVVTTLKVNNCHFEGFDSWIGGAIATGPGSQLNMQNSVFRLNTAQSFLDPKLTPKYGFGGAVAVLGTADIRSCVFLSNGAHIEAGALGWCPTATTDTFTMQDSLISSNIAGQYGGGASLTDGTYQYGSVTCLFARTPAKLQAVRFAYNGVLEDQVLGGALYLGQNSEVSCSLFANNTANELSITAESWGGAIYLSGFYRTLPDETYVQLNDVYFAGNVAEFGDDAWVDSYSTITALSYSSTSSRKVETRSGLIAKPVIIPCQPPQKTRQVLADDGQGEGHSPFHRILKERAGGNSSRINKPATSGGASQCSGLCYPPSIPSAPV